MDFSDIAEGENAAKTIKEMVKSGKVPGAFIFGGEGREAISNALAKTIVCQNLEYKKSHGEACGICKSCQKAEREIHPDIMVTRPESDAARSFHIDKIRNITENLYFTPNDSETKVHILLDIQTMTAEAQNALLKSLEEPPPFAVFVMTVSDFDLILETVKSRAVCFYASEKKAAKKSPQAHEGLILDILAQTPEKKLPIYQNLIAKTLEKADKSDILDFYSYLENALRDVLVAKIFMPYENSDVPDIPFLYFANLTNVEKIGRLANIYSANKILSLSKKIQEYKKDLEYNVNIRLNLTSFLSCMNNNER
ncbi:MAG: hypothetical protein FWH48_05965 [Oscillospiraceae bacterium]|nr:hypothetical protein [Oscillospiraceae bacterium]